MGARQICLIPIKFHTPAYLLPTYLVSFPAQTREPGNEATSHHTFPYFHWPMQSDIMQVFFSVHNDVQRSDIHKTMHIEFHVSQKQSADAY